MKVITSADNRIYKAVAQLKSKKYRDSQQKYLIEGTNLIREAVSNGAEIEMLIFSPDYGNDMNRDEKSNTAAEASAVAKEAEQYAEKVGASVVAFTPQLFRKLADTETPQGIMAVVRKRTYGEEDFFGLPQSDANIIVLDRLQDPGNIGTILRTADAAGYLGAIVLKGTADIYSSKIIRAATGSLFRLPVLQTETPEETIRLLRKYKKQILCTTLQTDRYYYDIDFVKDTALIIGNEGNGVCKEFLIDSDLQVKIPMEGPTESLNAAVAAGILMYESVRQRYQRLGG